MTKDILIFGSIRHISITNKQENKDMVLTVRKELANKTYVPNSFDVIPYEEDCSAWIIILYDNMVECRKDAIDNTMGYLLTGEGYMIDLPFPIIPELKFRRIFTASYFGKMWEKNSVEMGGDPFILEEIRYTANGMYVKVKFV